MPAVAAAIKAFFISISPVAIPWDTIEPKPAPTAADPVAPKAADNALEAAPPVAIPAATAAPIFK